MAAQLAIDRLIYWKVRCINRTDKKFFDRYLVLDESKLTDDQRVTLDEILPHDGKHAGFLALRSAFQEVQPTDLDGLFEGKNSVQSVSLVAEYFEDETGKGLGVIGLAQIMTGEEYPILMGNSASVRRVGPTPISNAGDWTEQKANDISHFLHLVIDLLKSDWLTSPLTLTMQGGKITGFEHPGHDRTKGILLYVRQLLLKRDDVLNVAAAAYLPRQP